MRLTIGERWQRLVTGKQATKFGYFSQETEMSRNFVWYTEIKYLPMIQVISSFLNNFKAT